MKLQGKTAIITGGSSGIGRAIVERFKQEGALVHLFDIQKNNTPKDTEFHKVDVTKQEDCTQKVDAIANRSGIDILVNAAGISHIGKLEDTTEADMDQLYQVNVKGVYNTMLACIKHMKTREQSAILNIASIVSHIGIPDRFAYAMTKGAVLTMTYAVACDYLQEGIRCNSISPARIHTPFVDSFLAKNYPGKEKEMFEKLGKTQPIGRMGKPEEVAEMALFLCSETAGFITGTDFPVDGGFLKLKP